MKINEIDLSSLKDELERTLSSVQSPEALEDLKREWLSKDGHIKDLFKQLREVPADRKAETASHLNEIRERLEGFVASREEEFRQSNLKKQLASQGIDPSLPSKFVGLGRLHPVTRIERRIAEILRPFGFVSVLGPEVETEYFCFDALNIPAHHPARDMQDTFYTDSGHLLRTHTTSVQARSLQKGGLPLKVASFGKVYRNETEDASHQAMFHQFELVWLEEGLTLAHLMAIISHILKGLYGKRRRIRFVPKFYPYTEPSIGPQINCALCNGKGCPACGQAGWVTIGGAGMVHRNVLNEFKYDPEKVSGFAFGLGTSRLASQMYDVPKLKMLYDNDLRILRAV